MWHYNACPRQLPFSTRTYPTATTAVGCSYIHMLFAAMLKTTQTEAPGPQHAQHHAGMWETIRP